MGCGFVESNFFMPPERLFKDERFLEFPGFLIIIFSNLLKLFD
jgi:hypothetical protein